MLWFEEMKDSEGFRGLIKPIWFRNMYKTSVYTLSLEYVILYPVFRWMGPDPVPTWLWKRFPLPDEGWGTSWFYNWIFLGCTPLLSV